VGRRVHDAGLRPALPSEARKNLVTSRTFKICNFWIAQLLILAYITMAI
jgi:hypothetical protein